MKVYTLFRLGCDANPIGPTVVPSMYNRSEGHYTNDTYRNISPFGHSIVCESHRKRRNHFGPAR